MTDSLIDGIDEKLFFYIIEGTFDKLYYRAKLAGAVG